MPTLAEVDSQVRSAEPTRRLAHLPSDFSSLLNSDAARLLGLVGLYSFLAIRFIRSFYLNDPDIWWHLRTGDWILAHHTLPFTDPFSSFGMGKPWVAYSWLFDLVTAVAFARLNFIAIAAFEIATRVILSVALFHLVRGVGTRFWRAVGLTALALVVMTEVIGPRPGMLTIFFVILELDILLTAARTGNTKTLWLLPPMFVLWANWHIQFVYGLFVLGVFAVEPALNLLTGYTTQEKSLLPIKQTWLVLAASGLATLVNPYGWRIYSTVFLYAGQSGAYSAITELRAMTFREPQHYLLLLLALGAAMTLGWRRNARPLWLILLAFTSVMAFRSVKEVWFLAVVAAAIMGADMNRDNARRDPTPLKLRLAVAVCVLAAVVFSCVRYELTDDWLALQVGSNFPEGASRYLQLHRLPGPLLNDLSWGGFLIWRLPQLPVAIDGRTNVHGDDRIQEFSNLWTGKPGWATDPELMRANLVITPSVSAICGLLRGDPRFVVAYEDTQAVVFRRRS